MWTSIESLSANGGGFLDADTAAVADTWEAAVHAAGGAVALVDSLLGGAARTGVSALRPPGHHAERDACDGLLLLRQRGGGGASGRGRRTASSGC